MPILSLEIKNVGPFEGIKFNFDRQLNVFVGPNNSGKSATLAALGEIFVYPFLFPVSLLREEPAQFKIRYALTGGKSISRSGQLPILPSDFWSTEKLRSWLSFLGNLEYAMFVPALRQSTDFRSKGPIAKEKDEDTPYTRLALQDTAKAQTEVAQIYHIPSLAAREAASFGRSAYVSLDKHIIQKMIELDYRAYREKNVAVRKIIDKVASISSDITEGFSIRFVGIGEDKSGLFPEFETPDGIVPLNVLSQGTQSIIHTLSLVLFGFAQYHNFPKDIEKKSGILMIDEIDAHLHPSWQRRFLPALTKHFPNMQIFCCTHSPLVLGGLAPGQIQLLKREPGKPITVTRNEHDVRGWSFEEILRYLLDVTVPTDLDTENLLRRLQELQNREHQSPRVKAEISKLRKKVNERLITGQTDAQIATFEKSLKKARTQVDKNVRRES